MAALPGLKKKDRGGGVGWPPLGGEAGGAHVCAKHFTSPKIRRPKISRSQNSALARLITEADGLFEWQSAGRLSCASTGRFCEAGRGDELSTGSRTMEVCLLGPLQDQ